MLQFISNGGPFGWLLFLLLFVLLGLTAYRIFQSAKKEELGELKINQILYLGVFSAVVGFTATLTGIFNASSAISQAADTSPQIIWGGVGVALSTSILGFIILLLSLLGWFVIKSLQR